MNRESLFLSLHCTLLATLPSFVHFLLDFPSFPSCRLFDAPIFLMVTIFRKYMSSPFPLFLLLLLLLFSSSQLCHQNKKQKLFSIKLSKFFARSLYLSIYLSSLHSHSPCWLLIFLFIEPKLEIHFFFLFFF